MFTHTIHLSKAHIVVALLSLSLAQLGHAQITKCVDANGTIVYSDTSCGDATAIGVVNTDAAVSVSSAPIKKDVVLTNDRGQIRETPWTYRSQFASKKTLDKLTIRDARAALTESDRAIAALRHQTIAAND